MSQGLRPSCAFRPCRSRAPCTTNNASGCLGGACVFQQREVVNYTLDGTKLHLLLQFSVLPGRERDWSLVQVALTDITARKKADVNTDRKMTPIGIVVTPVGH